MNKHPIIALLAAVFLVQSAPVRNAKAEIIHLRLSGTIEVGDSAHLLPDDIITGTPFVACWSYDASLPNTTDPDQTAMFGPAFGKYEHPLADPYTASFGLSVQINEHVFRLDTSQDPYVVAVIVGRFLDPNKMIVGGGDSVGTASSYLIVPFEYRTAYTIQDQMSLSFQDGPFATSADSSLPSIGLPRTLDSDTFGSAAIGISGASFVSVGGRLPPSYNIFATIDAVAVIPEPTGFSLFFTISYLFLCWHRF